VNRTLNDGTILSLFISKYYPRIHMKGLKKITEASASAEKLPSDIRTSYLPDTSHVLFSLVKLVGLLFKKIIMMAIIL
jgi:hypothetical protein